MNKQDNPSLNEVERIIAAAGNNQRRVAEFFVTSQQNISVIKRMAETTGSTTRLFALEAEYYGLGTASLLCPDLAQRKENVRKALKEQ